VLLAELDIRHTRRHMSTRRVGLGDVHLPSDGVAYGPLLLGCVVAANIEGIDDEQRSALDGLLREARHGLVLPKRALRFRLQTDLEGLAQSRHRLLGADGGLTVELDVHGAFPPPQVLGAVMAAAAMAAYPRRAAFRAIDQAVQMPGLMPEGVRVTYLTDMRAGPRPSAAGARVNGRVHVDPWRGVSAERRWAMEVFGFGADVSPPRDEVLRRFRRLVRLAHPDHGGVKAMAAARIGELGEARRLLLGFIDAH
jgi:hypothetical protein